MQARRAVLVLLGVTNFAAVLAEQPFLFSAPIYNAMNFNDHQWWVVMDDTEVRQIQGQAALFASGLQSSPDAFAGMLNELVAEGKKVEAARALAYMLNANMTLSGGCPSPPAGTSFTNSLVAGLTQALRLAAGGKVALAYAGNATEADVADTLVGGISIAGQSCGPPNSLSTSAGTAGEIAQYLNSTCYYVGPVLAPCTNASAVLKKVLAADVASANSNDPYGSGAVLSAAQECLAAGPIAQLPPAWLSKVTGPIDEQERAETIPVEQLAMSMPAAEAPLDAVLAPDLAAPSRLVPGEAPAGAQAPAAALRQQQQSGGLMMGAPQQGAVVLQDLGGRRMAL